MNFSINLKCSVRYGDYIDRETKRSTVSKNFLKGAIIILSILRSMNNKSMLLLINTILFIFFYLAIRFTIMYRILKINEST